MSSATAIPIWAKILLQDPVNDSDPHASEGSEVRSCLVLLAHGSKDPRWREPFEKVFVNARREYANVKLAYMEFTGPTLPEVAEECAREGVRRLEVLPLFMAAGAHLATDVPEQVEQIRRKHPDLRMKVLPPIGEDPRMSSLMRRIIHERLEQS